MAGETTLGVHGGGTCARTEVPQNFATAGTLIRQVYVASIFQLKIERMVDQTNRHETWALNADQVRTVLQLQPFSKWITANMMLPNIARTTTLRSCSCWLANHLWVAGLKGDPRKM